VLPPAGGFDTTRIARLDFGTIIDVLRHAVLPLLAIVLGNLGFWALGMRSQMVSVLGEDYILFAEAKGLSPWRIFFRYGMRNAMLSQITALALAMGAVLSGAVLVEVLRNYPALARCFTSPFVGRTILLSRCRADAHHLASGVAVRCRPRVSASDPRIRR
jgi:ABC-type dipeptide/oligopeptide/nickel transport system permease component